MYKIHTFFCCLFVLLCGTSCAGAYVLTDSVIDFSFSEEGLTPAYQKSVRYQAASWGLYNWFPERKRAPLSSEEIVVYGKARRAIQAHEPAGFLLGIPANFFVPQYEWIGEVNILKENNTITIPAKAVFASGDKIAHFYSVLCGDAVITVQDIIAEHTLIGKAGSAIEDMPYCFAVCSLPGSDYTVYITARREFRPIGKQGNRAAGSGPPSSLLDLVTLKPQVFQIIDSKNKLAAEYSNFRTTVYDNVPESDKDLLLGCVGMLHLIVNIANNSAGI